MGVTGASNDRTVFVDLFFIVYFLCSFPARIQELRSLQLQLFCRQTMFLEQIHIALGIRIPIVLKKINKSLLYPNR